MSDEPDREPKRGLASGHAIVFADRQKIRDYERIVSREMRRPFMYEDLDDVSRMLRAAANWIDNIAKAGLPAKRRS